MDGPSKPTDRDAPASGPKRVAFREAAAWGFGLVATLGAAVVAATAAVVLTTFGLGGVVLVAVAAIVLTGATIWRRGMLPLSVVVLALALPATWAAHADQRLDRSRGSLTVEPRTPTDVARGTYRLGTGPVLIDLRGFAAPPRSTTRIAARADDGRLVVALPRGRCFNLDVRFHNDALADSSSFALRAVRAATGTQEAQNVAFSSVGFTTRAIAADNASTGRAALAAFKAGETTSPYGLLAFNRWATQAGAYRRPAAGQPSAPTLRLDLRSSQQIVIRDYPRDVDPRVVAFSDATGLPVGGIAWPEGLVKPLAPPERVGSGRSVVRTPQNRARWIAWEQQMVDWAKAQAKRAAGPCASIEDLRARGFSFLTQPEAVRKGTHADRLLGTPPYRRSSIRQRPVDSPDAMLLVEVDGLGDTRVLRVRPRAGNADTPVSP